MQEDLSNDWFDDYIEDYRERIEVLTRLKKRLEFDFAHFSRQEALELGLALQIQILTLTEYLQADEEI